MPLFTLKNQFKKKRLFQWPDFVLIIILLLFSLRSITASFNNEKKSDILITVGSKNIVRFPLNDNRTITVKGYIGKSVISVSNGLVRMKESACKKQICVHHKPMTNPWQQIICAPNCVSVTIIPAGRSVEIDAYTK